MKTINRLICFFTKHKRGKRVATVNGVAQYECRRCKTQWHRKLKAEK